MYALAYHQHAFHHPLAQDGAQGGSSANGGRGAGEVVLNLSSPYQGSVGYMEDILAKEHASFLQIRYACSSIGKIVRTALASGFPLADMTPLKEHVVNIRHMLQILSSLETKKSEFSNNFVEEVTRKRYERVTQNPLVSIVKKKRGSDHEENNDESTEHPNKKKKICSSSPTDSPPHKPDQTYSQPTNYTPKPTITTNITFHPIETKIILTNNNNANSNHASQGNTNDTTTRSTNKIDTLSDLSQAALASKVRIISQPTPKAIPPKGKPQPPIAPRRSITSASFKSSPKCSRTISKTNPYARGYATLVHKAIQANKEAKHSQSKDEKSSSPPSTDQNPPSKSSKHDRKQQKHPASPHTSDPDDSPAQISADSSQHKPALSSPAECNISINEKGVHSNTARGVQLMSISNLID